MNKLFTLLIACGFGLAANAQTYIADDWTGGTLTSNNAWTTYTTDATFDWFADDQGSPGNFYAKMLNYDGSNNAVTAWLITPVLNFTSASQPELEFRNAYNYSGDALKLHISTDYTGSGDPSVNGTWTDLTSSANWSTGSFNWVNSGVIDLSAYNGNSTVYIAFEYTGTASDGSTWEVDDFEVAEYTPPAVLSIYDIQYTLNDPAASPEVGNEVTTSGVVTALNVAPATDGYYIQDADGSWNGIFVVDSVNTPPSVGDSVEITGTVSEFFGMTRMEDLTAFTNHGAATTYMPAATNISTNDAATLEEYESVMVTLTDAECTDDNPGFGLWTVNDGSGAVNVDDDCFDNSGTLGNFYELTGPISYTYDEFKINPRTGADIQVTGYASINDNQTGVSIYPNPATDNIVINAQPNALVSIYSITGAIVINGVSNKTLDISDLDAGIYQVVITENGTKSTQKLIVK